MVVNTFIKIEDKYIPISKVKQRVPNQDYIEGAIEIIINENPILTIQHGDYIDQLWSYIWDGLIALLENEAASFFFPDQPVKMSFELINFKRVKVSVEDRKVNSEVVGKSEFMTDMLDKCNEFFQYLPKFAPKLANYSQQMLQEIEELNW